MSDDAPQGEYGDLDAILAGLGQFHVRLDAEAAARVRRHQEALEELRDELAGGTEARRAAAAIIAAALEALPLP